MFNSDEKKHARSRPTSQSDRSSDNTQMWLNGLAYKTIFLSHDCECTQLVWEDNMDDREMKMVLLKTWICTRITDILGAADLV